MKSVVSPAAADSVPRSPLHSDHLSAPAGRGQWRSRQAPRLRQIPALRLAVSVGSTESVVALVVCGETIHEGRAVVLQSFAESRERVVVRVCMSFPFLD
jgi:hypothetical protein